MLRLPLLTHTFPMPVRALHQIEISSRCNLRCTYCPSPNLGRPKVDMDRQTYGRALMWVRHFVQQGTQDAINLAGIGESTLHPRFIDYLRLAREAIGETGQVIFATNGLIADEDFVKQMVPYRPDVWVSLHRPEKAGRAVDTYARHGLLRGVSVDPSLNPNDWAGQVNWVKPAQPVLPCQWLREGKIVAFADGRLSTCCLDASGIGFIGHVNNVIGTVLTKPYKLCASCYQEIGVTGYDQRGNP